MKRKKMPEFKAREQVCFLLPKKNSSWDKAWHIGEIVALIETKKGEDPMVEVLPYEIPEHFHPSGTEEEWSSLALLQVELPLEMIILNRLASRTRVEHKKSSKTVKVFMRDICKATHNHFRRVLTEGVEFSLQSKRTFW